MTRALLIVVVLAALAASSRAQTPQFRTGTALVVVDVVATRADGNVARDLTAADFEILEDGRPQIIKTFRFIDLEEGPDRDLPSGVFSNLREPGAIFALVIDEMKIDVQHTGKVRQWASRLINQYVRPHDYAAVLRSGHDSGLFFTSDRDFLNAIVEQSSPRRATSATAGLMTAAEAQMTGLSDPIGREAVRGTEDSLYMLRQLVQRLAAIPARRKAIFWFSQGVTIEFDVPNASDGAGNNSARTSDSLRELLAAARHGNVAIYGIDPRGLYLDDNIGPQSTATPQSTDIDGMRDIADATGGRAIVNTNDLAGGIDQIVRENRAYYLLGYEPVDRGNDRTRRLDVRTRTAGVTLLHRRAYVPDSPNAKPPVEGALGAVLPGGELGISMAPSIVVDPKGQLVVSVPFEITNAMPADGAVTFTLAALKMNGTPAMALGGKVSTIAGTGGDRARLTLDPGLYQLRLAADSANAERRGVAFATIRVPDDNVRDPQCGGFLLLQGEKARANVSHVLNASGGLSGLAVVAAREEFGRLPVTLGIGPPGKPAERTITLGDPRQFKKGYWNIEYVVPSLPLGLAELTLLAGGKPLPGCTTTVLIQ